MLLALDLFSTVCFGCAGASIARRNRLNHVAVVLSAFFASTGGGTIRDVVLRHEAVFWLENPGYLLAVLLSLVLTVLRRPTARVSNPLCRLITSLATSVFVMVGALAAVEGDCNSLVVLFSGVLTGIGGGIVRQAVFERKSVLHNREDVFSALTIALFCAFLLAWGSHVIVAIFMLASVHFILIECNRKFVPKKLDDAR